MRLRALSDNDAPLVTQLFADERITKWLLDAIAQPFTLEDAKAFIFFARGKGSTGRDFAIEANGTFAGILTLHYGEDVYAHTAQIGYAVLPQLQGQGIATRAIQCAVSFAREKRGLQRVYANVLSENAASRRALGKAGFAHEATLHCGAKKAGRLQDLCVYAQVFVEESEEA